MDINDHYAAVLAAPDDDAPRIAYADFIEPYDASRAAFIRLQLQRWHRDRAARETATTMGRDELANLGDNWLSWATMFRSYRVESPVLPWGFYYERGFVAHVRMAIENVSGLGERLYAFAPIQHLDVAPPFDPSDDSDPLRIFSKPVGFERLESVSFAGLNLGDRGAKAIAECEALKRASWLDLRGNGIGRNGLVALIMSPIMATKVRVLLDHDVYTPAMLEEAVGRPLPWLHSKADRYAARWLRQA